MACRRLLVAALLTLPTLAQAGVFAVKPVRLELDKRARTSLLTITNQSDEPIRLQVKSYAWSETPQGKMDLKPTDDLVVFPTLLSIPPGQARKLRVGVLGAVKAREQSYRVFVEQLPPMKDDSGATQIKVLLRMGIPVFFTPDGAKAEPQLEDVRVDGTTVAFRLRNHGSAHTRATSVRLRALAADGSVLREAALSAWYLLAQGYREYEAELPADICPKTERVAVEVETLGASLEATANAHPSLCGR